MRQAPLDVGAFAIPGEQAMDGKGMPEIVETTAHADGRPERDEVAFDRGERNGLTPLVAEEGRRGRSPRRGHVGEDLRQLRPQRQLARLVEFRLPDQDRAVSQIHVVASQREEFAEPQAAAVQEQQHGAEGRRGDRAADPRLIGRHPRQQSAQFLVGVNVWDEGLGDARNRGRDRRVGGQAP